MSRIMSRRSSPAPVVPGVCWKAFRWTVRFRANVIERFQSPPKKRPDAFVLSYLTGWNIRVVVETRLGFGPALGPTLV